MSSTGTRTHFTAWYTSDSSALEGRFTDVTVLEDRLSSDEDQEDQGDAAWTCAGGEPLLHAVTAVTVDDSDSEHGLEAAAELLEEAGWRLVGGWLAVPTGACVTVERA
ncbi:hypothetical protein [Streptomyces anulatus]|uniref:hypothetical protein n=1 Tax=Streptomyces anulatus TaxID=1892 RepID=UPI0037DCF728|nr:hypothetical protein OHB50_38925 [Streptomyces anulatus]